MDGVESQKDRRWILLFSNQEPIRLLGCGGSNCAQEKITLMLNYIYIYIHSGWGRSAGLLIRGQFELLKDHIQIASIVIELIVFFLLRNYTYIKCDS